MLYQKSTGGEVVGYAVDSAVAGHERQRWRLLGVEEVVVEPLSVKTAAVVLWGPWGRRVLVSVLIPERHHHRVALHALRHVDDTSSPAWGEATAWCHAPECLVAQFWLPDSEVCTMTSTA